MSTLKFKTNIKCSGCLAKVKPFLNGEGQIEKWEVDLQSEDRILTVETEQLPAEQVQKTLMKAGFDGEQIK